MSEEGVIHSDWGNPVLLIHVRRELDASEDFKLQICDEDACNATYCAADFTVTERGAYILSHALTQQSLGWRYREKPPKGWMPPLIIVRRLPNLAEGLRIFDEETSLVYEMDDLEYSAKFAHQFREKLIARIPYWERIPGDAPIVPLGNEPI